MENTDDDQPIPICTLTREEGNYILLTNKLSNKQQASTTASI